MCFKTLVVIIALSVMGGMFFVVDTQAQTASSTSTSTSLVLTKNYRLYDKGIEVFKIQQFLNGTNFPVASTGVGSSGKETNFFGVLTLRALKLFQASQGLPPTGFLGPMTRAVLAAFVDPNSGGGISNTNTPPLLKPDNGFFTPGNGFIPGFGAGATSVVSQTSTPASDTTGPVVSSIASSTALATSTITWTTDETADSLVEYGTTSSYGSATSSSSLVTSHSLTITGLTAGTTYHFRVKSIDAQGNVTTSNDKTFTTVQEGNIFVFGGQSNAGSAGISGAPPANIVALGPEVQIWNVNTHAFVEYVPGTNANLDASQSTLWGPEAEFARQWVADNPGKTIYIVKRAQSSTPLALRVDVPDWSTSSTGELYDELETQITEAKAALYAAGMTPVLKNFSFMQGESDGNNSVYAAAYETNLTTFIAALRADWGNPDIPVVLGRISNSATITNPLPVRAAQIHRADVGTGINIISTDAYDRSGDDLHYTNTGVVDMGSDFYAAYKGTYTFPAVPDQFAFTDVTLQPLSTVITSAAVTITGLRAAQAPTVTISGTGEFQVYDTDGTTVLRAWGTAAATVGLNQQVKIRMTSSSSGLTAQTATLTVGGVSDTWSVTTQSSSFDPATLSPTFWYDIANGGLFQSNGGTTAATANGDLVGFLPDRSSNTVTQLSAADDTTRPTLQGVGVYPYLDFDGSTDVLRNTTGINAYTAGAATWCFALKGTTAVVGSHIAAESNPSVSNNIYAILDVDNVTRTTASSFIRTSTGTVHMGGTEDIKTGVYNETDVVYCVVDNGSSLTPYLDGVAGTPVNYSIARGGATMTTNRFALGALVRSTTTGYWRGRMYAAIGLNRVPTAQEIADMTTWLGAKQGRTL